MTVEITVDQVTDLSDYLLDNVDATLSEGDDLGVFRTYSGRGMYGKECLGVVISGPAMFELAFCLSEWLRDADMDYDMTEAFKHPSTDSMGYDTIVYWKGIQVVNEDDE